MMTDNFSWPFVTDGPPPNPDPEKPMCIGIQTGHVWGDGHGNYTGRCRYGMPIAPMQAAIRTMDRRVAIGTAKEDGLNGNIADKLATELRVFDGLTMVTGEKRLKRYAQQQTNAAKDAKDGNKPSVLKRSLLNCALWGGIAMTGENLMNAILNHKGPGKDTIKAGAIACSTAVISTPLNRWIKSKGYDMED